MRNSTTITGRLVLKRSNFKEIQRGTKDAISTHVRNMTAPWMQPIEQPTPEGERFIDRLFAPLVDVDRLYGHTRKLSPEQRLALALLTESIDDARNPKRKYVREGARAWLRLRYRAVYGADECCTALGVDYHSLRKRLELEWEGLS